jgi:hypothetical protein
VLVSVVRSVIALVLTISGPSGGGAAAAQRSDSLILEAGGRVTVLRRADLAGLPRDTVRASFHGGPVLSYTGVRLPDLLRGAGVAIDSLRGPALASRVVVDAADGYRVVFSLAELSPSFAGRPVVLADRVGGRPLPEAEGPFRLLAPGDGGEHARWVRGVVAIRVRTD